MADLFAALEKHPVTALDQLDTKASQLKTQAAYDRLFPLVNTIASYEGYSSPTNWRPVLPTESAQIVAHHGSLPFSDNLSRIGAQVSMPIFDKKIFSLANQAASLSESSKIKKKVNLLERQAVLVSSDAHLIHMQSLEKALESRKKSLEKTRADVILQVKNGRLPEAEKIRLDEAINQIELSWNQTRQRESDLRKSIESLTGIFLTKPLPLGLKEGSEDGAPLPSGEILALKPLEKNVEAEKYGIQAAKDKLYPRIIGSARWSHNYGEAYNTGKDVDGEYSSYALTLQMPIFNKPVYTEIELARIKLRRNKARLAKTKIALEARGRNLKETLKLLEQSKKLDQTSVSHEQELLEVAKVAYAARRMEQEEYLRYEEKVLSAQANLYLTEARWWETFSTLAALYGDPLAELVE